MRIFLNIITIVLLSSSIVTGCLPNQYETQIQSHEAKQLVVRDDRIDQAALPIDRHEEPDSTPALLPPLPDQIELTFETLELRELPTGEPSPDWVFEKRVTLELEQIDVEVALYREASGDDRFRDRLHGVLTYRDRSVLLHDVSLDLMADDLDCYLICVFSQTLPGQDHLLLVGTVDKFANGPGLRTYVIYDKLGHVFRFFDAWGEPDFIDLDGDGDDELIIEFPGLHLNWPDVVIVRTEAERLEISWSVVHPAQRETGDYAILVKDKTPPRIRFSNIRSEEEPAYDYVYDQGSLQRCESGSASAGCDRVRQ